MTDTEVALLRAVAANPDEDTPRLIYADYLDEQGEPARAARAEFIRLHVRAERLPADHPERPALQERITQLLCAWDTVWQHDMPAGCKALAFRRRGFVYRAAVNAALLGSDDDARLATVEYVELQTGGTAHRLGEALRHPLFARVKELVVRGFRAPSWVVSDPAEWLGLSGARALAGAEFPRLERLVLGQQGIGSAGLRALCESWGFPRLRELDVSYNDITDAGAEALLSSPLLGKLRHLNLSGNPIGREALERVRPGRTGW